MSVHYLLYDSMWVYPWVCLIAKFRFKHKMHSSTYGRSNNNLHKTFVNALYKSNTGNTCSQARSTRYAIKIDIVDVINVPPFTFAGADKNELNLFVHIIIITAIPILISNRLTWNLKEQVFFLSSHIVIKVLSTFVSMQLAALLQKGDLLPF